jgi:hypothetical protein
VELFARYLLVAMVTLQAVSPLASVFFIPNEDGLGLKSIQYFAAFSGHSA